MCDPITIAGVALTGASVVANTIANNQIAAARNEVLGAERMRQQNLDQEAQTYNDTARNRYEDFSQQQDERAQSLADFYKQDTGTAPAPDVSVPQSSNNIVVQEENKQREKAKAFTDANAEALAGYRSFGDLLAGLDLMRARDAGSVAQIGGFKRGSAGVMPLELDNAKSAGNGAKLFADIAGGLGSVGTMAGLSGGTLFGVPLGAANSPIDLLVGVR